jgi:hypothetical protein
MFILYKKVMIYKKPIISAFDNPIYQKATESEDELEEGEIAEEKLKNFQ